MSFTSPTHITKIKNNKKREWEIEKKKRRKKKRRTTTLLFMLPSICLSSDCPWRHPGWSPLAAFEMKMISSIMASSKINPAINWAPLSHGLIMREGVSPARRTIMESSWLSRPKAPINYFAGILKSLCIRPCDVTTLVFLLLGDQQRNEGRPQNPESSKGGGRVAKIAKLNDWTQIAWLCFLLDLRSPHSLPAVGYRGRRN